VPGFVNLTDADVPGLMSPVSKAPAVAVWVTVSEFLQVTLSPTLIVSDAGAKAKPEIATERFAATATAPPTSMIDAIAMPPAMSN
jgi:hypothetical protein